MEAFKKIALVLIALVSLLSSCVKDADIDIPGAEEKLVVEGFIEPGMPPIVILTRNKPYFGTSNFGSFEDLLVHNANVVVSDGMNTVQLTEICTGNLPDSILLLISSITGLDTLTLQSINFCLYSTFNSNIFGQYNRNYSLTINAEGKTLTAVTQIPNPVALDSIWYKNEAPYTDRGFCWARLNDPDTIGNAYRWFAMRKGVDNGFASPIGGSFEDKFIDGQSFEFAYNRARSESDGAANAEYFGYFKTGDTIIVKFCTIDLEHYQFWRTYDTQVINNGNPFAAPTSINSNINGGLGVWGGYGVSYDTTIAQ